MSQKVVIFGAGGQLGTELKREFSERGFDVRGYGRPDVDITSRAQVEAAIAAADPQVVVNAAAYNMVDVAEKDADAAFQINALAVRNLALAARQVDACLVHFSTDYVFDGRAGRPYTENDRPHPLGAYSVSKYAGELYAEAYLDTPLIVRTSGVFGPAALKTARGNFVELMLRLAASPNPIRVVEDHVGTPTYAPALASPHRGPGVARRLGPVPHRRWDAHQLVRLRDEDLRYGRHQAQPACHQRARVPHAGPTAEVLGAGQHAHGSARPGSNAEA